MWRRRNGTRVSAHSSSFGDLSSTTTSNEDFESNDDDEIMLESPKPKMLIFARSPQIQFQSHEAQISNMRETITCLQHQLDLATDRIAAFLLDKGESTVYLEGRVANDVDSLTDSINRKLREVQFKNNLETALRNVTAQASVMLAERRDMQAEVECTTAITLATEIRLSELMISSIKQKKDIISKIKSIQKLIIFENRRDDDDDEENEVNTEESNSFCSLPLFRCWTKPAERLSPIPATSSAKHREIEESGKGIFKELKDLHNSLHRKLEEFNSNAATDVSEIDMLKSIISENTIKLTKREHEIEILKVQLDENKSLMAHVTKQNAELNAFYTKVKVKLEKDVAETKALAAAAVVAAEDQAEKHILEKEELRAELISSLSSYDSMMRRSMTESIEENLAPDV